MCAVENAVCGSFQDIFVILSWFYSNDSNISFVINVDNERISCKDSTVYSQPGKIPRFYFWFWYSDGEIGVSMSRNDNRLFWFKRKEWPPSDVIVKKVQWRRIILVSMWCYRKFVWYYWKITRTWDICSYGAESIDSTQWARDPKSGQNSCFEIDIENYIILLFSKNWK